MRAEVTAHTHLFRGARVRLPADVADPLPPSAVRIRFSDGVDIDAELLSSVDDPRRLVLETPAYETGSGTAIRPRAWSIARAERAADGVVLVIGERLA